MKRTTLLTIIALAGSLAIGAQTATAQQQDQRKGNAPGMAPGQSMMGPGMMGRGMMGGGMMGGRMMGRGMMGGGMMGPMMQGNMMGRDCPMMGMMMGESQDSHMAGRIAFLKAELAITGAQQGAFDAYAKAIKDNIESMQAMRANMMSMMSAENPVERLDARLQMMEARTASLKTLKPALTALYDALDDTQKEKANTILTGMGCMM